MYLKPSKRKKARTRTVIIIAAAAAAAGVIALLFFLGVFPMFALSGNISAMDKYLPENAVFANENGILYNESDTLYLLDKDGVEQWNLALEMEGSNTIVSDDLICNYSGKTMQVMSYTKEQMFSTSIDTDILDVAVGANAIAILTQGTVEETGALDYRVSIFNTSGEQTGQVAMNGRQMVDFGFHGDSDMFWILSLDTANVLPVSYIAIYKTDGSMTFNIMINTQVVDGVYVTDNTIFATGTNSIASYTYFGEKQAEQQIYGWKPAAQSVGTNEFTLAYSPRSGVQEIEAARVFSADLTNIHIRLPRNVFSVAVTQERLYAFSADHVYVYLQDGRLEKTIDTDSEIVKVKQISDDFAVLWDQQKSYVMSLQ